MSFHKARRCRRHAIRLQTQHGSDAETLAQNLLSLGAVQEPDPRQLTRDKPPDTDKAPVVESPEECKPISLEANVLVVANVLELVSGPIIATADTSSDGMTGMPMEGMGSMMRPDMAPHKASCAV